MRVVVTGCRDADREWLVDHGLPIHDVIYRLVIELPVTSLATGGADGVEDLFTQAFSEIVGPGITTVYDDVVKMIDDFLPDLVLVFPWRRGPLEKRQGTTAWIDLAIDRGLPVRIYPIEPPT